METLVIYFGGLFPAKAVGKNQCRLLRFAHDNKGIHSYKSNCKATRKSVSALAKKGCILHYASTCQFEWNENFGK